MKILVTGNYEEDYNRNAIILKGFKQLGHEVLELPIHNKSPATSKKLRSISVDCDFIFLPSFTHKYVTFVKKSVSKPLVFDPLVSKYLTNIFDYKKSSRYSVRALLDFFKDKSSLSRSDLVIADTKCHADYYARVFRVKKENIYVSEVGVDCEKFFPSSFKNASMFKVGFYGGFIPLQGVLKILDAIKLLESRADICFELSGNGFQYDDALKKAKSLGLSNVNFPGWIDYQKLEEKINSFDLCLGIFGDSLKSDLVIPNKVYHYAACGKAVITKDSPAVREVFSHRKNIYLAQNSPESIAEAILHLKDNQDQASTIGDAARKLMESSYDCKHVASKVIDAVGSLGVYR